jgi:Domain of unknown function (DUF4214)/FG-GAP-like repeat
VNKMPNLMLFRNFVKPCLWSIFGIFVSMFSTTARAISDDAFEPNNTQAAARVMNVGTTYSTLVANNDDWYAFDSLTPGNIWLTLRSLDARALQVHLHQPNGSAIFSSHVSGATVTTPGLVDINVKVFWPGRYWVRVIPIEGTNVATNTYSLSVSQSKAFTGDDSFDGGSGNDSLGNGALVPLTNGRATIPNLRSLDDDFFKVELPRGTFTIDMTYNASAGAIGLELYTASGQRLNDDSFSIATPSGKRLTTVVDPPGTYYVAVTGSSGNAYSLSLASKTVWAKEFPYGPIAMGSVTLYDLDGDGVDEILVGTAKALDANSNEIAPAALLCVNADGTLRWAHSFPANTVHRSNTGQPYNTSSVGGAPLVVDLFNNGQPYIVVGTGGVFSGPGRAGETGQTGDLGAVYALDKNGNVIWSKAQLDTIGGPINQGDGIADGVWGSIAAFDIDNDGVKDLVWGGWDQRVYVVDGRTGIVKPGWPIHVLDTIGSTPKITDLRNNGQFKILIGSDITVNPLAQIPATGGVFHIFSADGQQNVSGFDGPVGNSLVPTVKGKFEEQVIWSAPVVADLDGDGILEIIYGTGLYDELLDKGQYIRVWNNDGSPRLKLDTVGQTEGVPLVVDLDGDGTFEIVATTKAGWVYAWNARGELLWRVNPPVFPNDGATFAIVGSATAVDLDGDGKLEIIINKGPGIIVLNHLGQVLTDPSKLDYIHLGYWGTPGVKDIDGDGFVDIISGGTNIAENRAVVYRFAAPNGTSSPNARIGRDQFNAPTLAVEKFVKRMYQTALNRAAEAAGSNHWLDKVLTKQRSGAEVAEGFFLSQEFQLRNLSDSVFLDTLYATLFDRAADAGGKANWQTLINSGWTRAKVVSGFTDSFEFDNLCKRFGILTKNPQAARLAGIRSFVERLYNITLARAADTVGLNHWTNGLANRTFTGGSVVLGFFQSTEYIQRNTSNSQFLDQLYSAYFNRAADPLGKNSWLTEMSRGMTRAQVIGGFAGSPEFAAVAGLYGLSP